MAVYSTIEWGCGKLTHIESCLGGLVSRQGSRAVLPTYWI